MKNPVLTILLASTFHVQAQNVVSTSALTDSLKKIGIDTFLIYKRYFPGEVKPWLETNNANQAKEFWCQQSDPIYIFYRRNQKNYIQKINECYRFKSILDTSSILETAIKQVDRIKNENVKKFQSLTQSRDTVTSTIDHTGITEIIFNCGNTFTQEKFDYYQLSKESSGEININYYQNHRTAVVMLSNDIEKMTLSGLAFSVSRNHPFIGH